MEFNRKSAGRDLLSSMEEIVTSGKLYGLEPMFFEKSNEELKYVSKTLSITIEEAMQTTL